VIRALLELLVGVIEILLSRDSRQFFFGPSPLVEPVKPADLPSNVIFANIAALKAEKDPAAALPRGWRSFQSRLSRQAGPALIAEATIGSNCT
jgi:hypothetical protein